MNYIARTLTWIPESHHPVAYKIIEHYIKKGDEQVKEKYSFQILKSRDGCVWSKSPGTNE